MKFHAQFFAIAAFTAAMGAALCDAADGQEGGTSELAPLDARRIEAAGARVVESKHLQLVTDVPASPGVDELGTVFDAAVPQWAAYFGLTDEEVASRRWRGFLIADRDRFAALGLLPPDNREFTNGYAKDGVLWLVEQPSDYYRRHLLLHEGTHAFMQTMLGGCGPPWYMEGMAELLGTHLWHNGQLKLGVVPADKNDVPMWGRIKLIRDAAAAGKEWPIERVLAVDNSRAMSTDHYAWTWAFAALLDGDPKYQKRFRALRAEVRDVAKFNRLFRASLGDDVNRLRTEWQAYVAELDYGYDVPQMAMTPREAKLLIGQGAEVAIAANKGWQSTGWLLRAGVEYDASASGRYQIAIEEGRPWPCEPGGVTIEYHDGRPLGMLIGAFVPVDPMQASGNAFAKPIAIGLGATIRPVVDSVLYLRVNDSPARLGDNTGAAMVHLAPGQ